MTTTEPAVTATGGTMEPAAATVTPVPVTPATPVVPDAPKNPWDDPAAAQAEIEKLRRENGAARTTAKTTAAAEERARILALLDPTTDTPTVESLSAAIKGKDQTITQKDADLTATKLELAVFRAAGTKYDAAALLDSRSFLDRVSTIDPADATALEAALSEAITANPRLRVSQAAAVGGADLTGGTGSVRTYTRAQLADTAFYAANKTDILAAYSEGRITA